MKKTVSLYILCVRGFGSYMRLRIKIDLEMCQKVSSFYLKTSLINFDTSRLFLRQCNGRWSRVAILHSSKKQTVSRLRDRRSTLRDLRLTTVIRNWDIVRIAFIVGYAWPLKLSSVHSRQLWAVFGIGKVRSITHFKSASLKS